MPPQFFSHLIEPSDGPDLARESFSKPITSLILILSVLIFLGALVPLFRLDFEFVLFLRSIHNKTIYEIGVIGNRLGQGITLVFISLALVIVGYTWKRDHFKRAGWQSLFAHGVAGLITKIMKHLFGRPRPRFMHQDQWQFGPSLQGGLDTFPSGHSAASFAVAAVLARHFPKGAWIWYGAAAFVALSRIARGSHFPTDSLAGALIGFLVGYVLARPIKAWFTSLIEALAQGLPYWVGGFGLMWITLHNHKPGPLQAAMFWLGVTMIVLGLGYRVLVILRQPTNPFRNHYGISSTNLLIGLGVALYTESVLVTLLALITSVAWWVGYSRKEIPGTTSGQRYSARAKNPAQEAFIGMAVIALLLGIQQIKGLIPLH